MSEIRCSGCGEIIDVPPELSSDLQLARIEPYYCDACEHIAETAADIDTTEYCRHCGKDLQDFSDLGCEWCDRRHPGFGSVV